jgi:hypothetical protein
MIKVSSHCIADFSGMDKFVKQAIKLSQQEVDIGFNQERHFLLFAVKWCFLLFFVYRQDILLPRL